MINKKKAHGMTLTWAIAFPIILVLMVGFLVITGALSGGTFFNKNKINFEGVENLNSQRELMKILNSPVNVGGENMNVKKLIELWFFDKDNYKSVLESEMKNVLNDFEYEYIDFQMENLRQRGFQLLIYSEKHVKGEGMPKELIRVSSEKYDGGYVVSDVQGARDLAGVYVSVGEESAPKGVPPHSVPGTRTSDEVPSVKEDINTEGKMVYVVLWGSQESKKEVKNEE